MAPTAKQLRDARSDKELHDLLKEILNTVFPMELREDEILFLSKLCGAPRGLRAMAATYDLDVSMALDDLAWHFINHPSMDFAEETSLGLRELGAESVAEVFDEACAIIKPHHLKLMEILELEGPGPKHDWLDSSGIQAQMNPLDQRMWKLLGRPYKGLFPYWYAYARKHPERCVL